MLGYKRVILIFALLCIVCHYSNATLSTDLSLKKKDSKKQAQFDYFVLSVQWPGTVCKQLGKSGCRIPEELSPYNFTIHGLWPNSYGSQHPFFCHDIPFDYQKMKQSSLYQTMKKYWADFLNAEASFWGHEWTKHGTCAMELPGFGDQQSYFSQVLNLYSRLPLFYVLAKHNIIPSNDQKYDVDDILGAFRDTFGVAPIMACSVKSYFGELRFCFTKQLDFMECPSSLRTTCDKSVYMTPITKRN